ncbi:hypothetical protein CFP56_043818 [Quercus suber]|uniref:Uncharacterized protein n=1 Tax=Quercus suber TaxID=58331 RepID=A0AAW0LIF7_QUESU
MASADLVSRDKDRETENHQPSTLEMKATLVVCFLLLSTFFIPSSNAARELAYIIAPANKPGASCGRGKSYAACKPPPKPKAIHLVTSTAVEVAHNLNP